MIPRFSLYGDPKQWLNNIKADPDGRWVNWKAVEPYVNYCEAQGVSFEQPEVEHVETTYTDEQLAEMVNQLDDIYNHEVIEEDDEVDLDVLEYMERHGRKTNES